MLVPRFHSIREEFGVMVLSGFFHAYSLPSCLPGLFPPFSEQLQQPHWTHKKTSHVSVVQCRETWVRTPRLHWLTSWRICDKYWLKFRCLFYVFTKWKLAADCIETELKHTILPSCIHLLALLSASPCWWRFDTAHAVTVLQAKNTWDSYRSVKAL